MGKLAGIITLLVTVLLSCEQNQNKSFFSYHGPVSAAENIETIYMENGMIKLTIKTPRVYEFANGDKEFPEGVYVEFYNNGQVKSTIRAENAYSFKEKGRWRGQGKVNVNNIETEQILQTEELFWNVEKERIFTDKFFTVQLKDETIYGRGLESAQNLSDYTILEPTGEFEMKAVE